MIEFHLDSRSGVSPYLQIVQQVRHALRLGLLSDGDQLPTVKDVVGQLAINPNTVLKAYRELEHAGLVEHYKCGRERRCHGHRSGNTQIARHTHPKACTFDLDLGQTGFVEQQREFTNERSVAGCKLCGFFVVRLARHDLGPNSLSCGLRV